MKTYNIINTIASIAILTFFASCEKVIDIDLEDTESTLVIEANLEKGENKFEVKISKTTNYFGTEGPLEIENAEVTLYNETTNESWKIPHNNEGKYSSFVSAVSNATYNLEVVLNGKTYTATSTLLEPIQILKLTSEESSFGPQQQSGSNVVYVTYKDPADVANYYRIVTYIDGEKQTGSENLIIREDAFADGAEASIPLFQTSFETEDTVDIEMRHIDETTYQYYNSLSDITSDGQGPNAGTAAPGNPVTNWSNGAHGYFGTFSHDTERIVIP